MPGKLNLKINQGETFRHTLLWKDENEVAIDLTGYTARMHIRGKLEDTTTLLTLTTIPDPLPDPWTPPDGTITIANPLLGEIRLYLSATVTSSIQWLSGVYDLEMVASNGDVIRLVEGKVQVTKEVTR